MPDSFVKKITMQLSWLRPVTIETPIGRIMGKAIIGTEEITSFGPFIRLRGQFIAQMVCNPGPMIEKAPHGILREYQSYEVILPNVAEQWLASYMLREDQGRPTDSTSAKTGVIFRPREDLGDVRFVVDISLRPPNASKPSEKGYEFAMAIAQADPRVVNPLTALVADLGEFAPFRPLQPALPQPVGSTGQAPVDLGPATEGATAQPPDQVRGAMAAD